MVKSLRLDAYDDTHGTSVKFAQTFNLRLLIHYLGDVHQPLHTVTRYSYEHKGGDMGGNLFKIKSDYDITNLHAFWDSIAEWSMNDFSIV